MKDIKKNLVDFIDPTTDHINKKPKISEDKSEGISTTNITENLFLEESQVGLLNFVLQDNLGFKGIVKHRFSDFLVNEIDLEGNVLHLEKEPKIEEKKVEELDGKENNNFKEKQSNETKEKEKIASNLTKPSEEEISKLLDALIKFYTPLIGNENKYLLEEFPIKIRELLENIDLKEERQYTIPIDLEDKSQRGILHGIIREYVGKWAETKTNNNNQLQIISITSNRIKRVRRPKEENIDNGYKFTYFIMYKQNRDTMDILNSMAKALRTDTKSFTFAGTKDKRGITVQRCSVKRMQAKRLMGLNKTLKDAKIGGVSGHDEPLRLGDLQGNQFTVVIRDIEHEEIDKNQTLDTLKTKIESILIQFQNAPGFINYYGMQRFGTNKIGTHTIGIALLKNQWKEAVEYILMPRPGDTDTVKESREAWYIHHDLEKALSLMPRYLIAERAILGAFKVIKDENNYLGAFSKVPRNLRLMYVHAYQSYVWNRVVSARLSAFGLKPVVGDLIYDSNGVGDIDDKKVRRLTNEDDLSQYSIEQVVFPLPGHMVIYPEYEEPLNKIYTTIMKEDDLDPELMIRNHKDYSLTGDYRKMIIRPKEFKWEFFQYIDKDQQIVLTDLDKINNVPKPQSDPNGDKLAVVLEFQLPSSGYATMLLRELMHQETDKYTMSNQSQYRQNQ